METDVQHAGVRGYAGRFGGPTSINAAFKYFIQIRDRCKDHEDALARVLDCRS